MTDRPSWLELVHVYQRRWLRRDVLAGLVRPALLVPQGMEYAELAGLPAVTDLYTTAVALLADAALGPLAHPGGATETELVDWSDEEDDGPTKPGP